MMAHLSRGIKRRAAAKEETGLIPIADENPTRRFPVVTVLIILANIAIFAYEVSLGARGLVPFVSRYAFVPARFLEDPAAPSQVLTIFTAMFMHAGWLHVGGNMLFLWIFGNNVEDYMGRLSFLAFYLSAGVAATFAQLAVAPATGIPNLGASGAVAGTLGAYLLLFPRASVTTLIPIFFFLEVARIPAFVVIGFWFLLQLGYGLFSLDPSLAQQGGVAFFAHLGGFAAGVLAAIPLAMAARHRRRRGS